MTGERDADEPFPNPPKKSSRPPALRAANADESAPPPTRPRARPVAPELPPKYESSPEFEPVKSLFERITSEISKVYVGQDDFIRDTLVAVFSGGHVLIESVPGLGKTLLVRTLGKTLGCKFQRIQFTADLMPSDITGQPIFDMREQQFKFRPGPVFTQFLLADEINRSPAKTHAALLEIMQERRVTIDGRSYPIEPPFLVMATQNPIESEGTYNLPEAQLDRFMMKLFVNYPTLAEENAILRLHSSGEQLEDRVNNDLQVVTNPTEIKQVMEQCRSVSVHDKVINYINSIVRKTRQWPQFYVGASPRAGISLLAGSRTLAAFAGRSYVVPDDVAELALSVLRHRVILSPEAEVEGRKCDDMLTELIRSIEVPRL